MEISPNDLLKLPREIALPLLEKMASELRTARQKTQCTDSLGHRSLENDVARLKWEKCELEASLTRVELENSDRLNRLEERVNLDVIAEPTFGFVYEDHEELRHRVENQDQTIENLTTKIATLRKKAAERKAEIKRLQRAIPSDADGQDVTLCDRLGSSESQLTAKGETNTEVLPDLASTQAQLELVHKPCSQENELLAESKVQEISGEVGYLFPAPWSCSTMKWPTDIDIDVVAFRKERFRDPCPLLPESTDLKPFSSKDEQPRISSSIRLSHPIFPTHRSSLMHHVRGLARTLAILPHERLISAGKWELVTHPIACGDVIEMTIQISYSDSSWIYPGRYKCLFFSEAPPKTLWSTMSSGQQKYLIESTVGHRNDIPVQKKMVAKRYRKGTLKIDCFGFERIGYNIELDKELHGTANEDYVRPHKRSSQIAETSFVARVRKRKSGDHGLCEGSSKRHKGPELEAGQGE